MPAENSAHSTAILPNQAPDTTERANTLKEACRRLGCSNNVQINVAGKEGYGIATIWDADILIWATSQIVAALERGLTPSPHIRVIPYQMLQDLSRDIGKRQYVLLKQSLDRLQTTTVTTTLRSLGAGVHQPFSWITHWHECVTQSGRHEGIEFKTSCFAATIFLSGGAYDGDQ